MIDEAYLRQRGWRQRRNGYWRPPDATLIFTLEEAIVWERDCRSEYPLEDDAGDESLDNLPKPCLHTA